MYADLGPGRMLDLDPPSPNGVDLLYSHEYVLNRSRELIEDWRTPHLYAYTDNNPVNRFDPSGLDWLDDITDNAFYKWLYTGDPNIDTAEYRKCCEPAGKYVTCHVNCMADVNKQLIAIAAGGAGAGVRVCSETCPDCQILCSLSEAWHSIWCSTGVSGQPLSARDVLPFPKWLARHLGFRVSGQSWFTSLARLKSTHPGRFCIPRAEREAWKKLANQIKARPGAPGTQVREIVRRGARGGIAAAAVLELLIALYCMDQCDRKNPD